MFGLLSQHPKIFLAPINDGDVAVGIGGDGYSPPSYFYTPTGSSGPVATTNTIVGAGYDLSPASIQGAVARGNTQSDILSAHQTYLSGIPVGRGGSYAISAQKQYGYGSIRDAAAAYLDAAGLRRLAESLTTTKIEEKDSDDDSGVLTRKDHIGDGDPFATLGDLVKVFERIFSTPSVTDTPAPVVVVGDTQQQRTGGGSSLGIVIAVLAIGAGAVYWFYLRKKGASGG